MAAPDEMLAYLEQLRAKVAQAEKQQAAAPPNISDSDEDEDNPLPPPLRVLERSVSYTNGDTYKGAMLGDQRHGQGTHTTSTGDVHTGSWQYDNRHGQGTFTAASGMVYQGTWSDDKATGSGRCTYPDGSVYDGDWLADERSGWGELTTADGQKYEGEWEADAPHGQGRWTFADGLSFFRGTYQAGQRTEGQLVVHDPTTKKPSHSYTGRFESNLRHGPEGVGVEEGLWLYRGDWREDARWGQGHCRFTDGSVYEGGWVRGMRQGNGRMTLADGTVYEGQWQDDTMHGAGRVKYPSGESYVGAWQQGQRHGQGKWTSAPKAVPSKPASKPAAASKARGSRKPGSSSSKEPRETYFGGWVAGKREGQGVAEYADGGRYEGQWKAGKRHGQGLMLFADGTVFRGAWEEDEWLQSAAEPALCRMNGPGLKGAVAGQRADFSIQARDGLSNPRLNGGDTFQVLLVPCSPHPLSSSSSSSSSHSRLSSPSPLPTAPAIPLQECDVSSTPETTTPEASTLLASTTPSSHQAASGKPVTAELSSYPIRTSSGSSSSSSSGASVGLEAYCTQAGAGTAALQQGWQLSSTPGAAAAGAAGAGAVIEAVAAGDVQDNGDGTYSCSYTHNAAGTYELHVTNGDGEHVAGSPCRVQITPGVPSARYSSVAGPGRSSAVAGCRAEFTVTFRDSFGNPCSCSSSTAAGLGPDSRVEARLVGSNSLAAAVAEVTPLPLGGFCCSYKAPSTPGLYVLEVVTTGGKHVGGSPFSVRVSPAPSAQTLSAAAAARTAASSSSGTGLTSLGATSATTEAGSLPSRGPDHAGTASCYSTSSSTPDTTTPGPPPAASAAAGVQDKLRWWGDVAKQAYEAVDGCLQGFEDATADSKTLQDAGADGMSASEADLVKANPSLPVVERLEDLWLLSRLQQERKAAQQQEQQQQEQAAKQLQRQDLHGAAQPPRAHTGRDSASSNATPGDPNVTAGAGVVQQAGTPAVALKPTPASMAPEKASVAPVASLGRTQPALLPVAIPGSIASTQDAQPCTIKTAAAASAAGERVSGSSVVAAAAAPVSWLYDLD